MKFQGLTVDDQSYLEAQDKARLLKYKTISQKAKNKFVEATKFFKNLQELKESQEELKVSFFIKKNVKKTSETISLDNGLSSK